MAVRINYNLPSEKKNAVVYARYSSHNQTEQSIEGQIAAAKTYAESKGYTIIKEYIDRAVSGRTDNRDQFQKMLSDCQNKQFQVIIVWKVDRFGRNRQEITFNKYRAKKYGVRVEYVAESLPDSPEGVILESVLEGMAEYYSLQLSQNISRGFRENAKKGKFFGGRIPLGYKLSPERTYEIDPKTAPLVKRIFNMYAEGNTTPEIVRQLNAEGLHTSQDKPFTKNSLRTLLSNRKYIGEFIYKPGTPDEIEIPNVMPQIVDNSTFDKVQEMLKINKRAPAHKWARAEYILTDKLFCGKCGGAMVGESGTGKSGAKYNYYLCTNHKRKKGCDKKAVRQDLIEDLVINQATQLIMNDETIEFIVDCVWKYYCDQDFSKQKIDSINGQLSDTEKSLANIMKAIEAGIPITDTFTKRIEDLTTQKTALEKALAEAKIERGFDLTRDHILFFLYQFKNLDYKDTECRKRLINTFINSVYITDDELIMTFNYGGDNTKITLNDIKSIQGDQRQVFGYCADGSTITRTAEHIRIYKNVFVIKKAFVV